MPRTYANCKSCSTPTVASSTSTFSLRQGDTCPDYTTQVLDQSGNSVSFQDWDVKVFMYFKSCLKSVDAVESYYGTSAVKLIGNQNFGQIKVGDIVGFEGIDQNNEEFMLVTDLDVANKQVIVSRGYGNTQILTHVKGERVLFYRIYGASGYVTNKNVDQENTAIDEAGLEDESNSGDYSLIGYHWAAEDTSHKGTYFLEMKVDNSLLAGSDGSESSVRTLPNNKEGYVVTII